MPLRDRQTMPALIALPKQRQGHRDPIGRPGTLLPAH
jgi:hypothetical protein